MFLKRKYASSKSNERDKSTKQMNKKAWSIPKQKKSCENISFENENNNHINNFKNYKAGKLVDENLQSMLNYHQKYLDNKVQESLELNSISFEYPKNQRFGKIVKNSSKKKLDKHDFDSSRKEKVVRTYFWFI